ncbi:amidase [Rhodococcus sp. TAF43]|uniref:amidase n=1 Tax=unclassified Rhodococcus (in: high G+C Gram-positive bacteria) TaxID=192944 RepID=UPI001583C606|nr:amidase [Rhodococcus sp. W8901]QKT09900.1 amidase [Rhodococcus sp. W8901]
MQDHLIEEFTAVSIAARVRSGALSPVDVVADALRRIEQRNPRINAFVRVLGERARAEAQALASRADLSSLPLAGVPVAIKDNVEVEGEPMRDGSAATDPGPSTHDHPTVARLRAAGAIPVGLTAVPELCVWGAVDSPGVITRNPWNPDRVPGGSSGGSAAAVADGMVPIALAADGMGSIRIPSAACGVFGIKPGRGLVPAELGAHSWFGMSENGPIATTVEDAALMLSVLADDPSLAEIPVSRPLRVGVAVNTASPILRVDADWARGVEQTRLVLAEAGHRTSETRVPYPPNMSAAFLRWFAGTADDAADLDPALLQPRTRWHAAIGRAVNRAGLVRSSQVDRLDARMRSFFTAYDVVLTPSLAQPPIEALPWSEKSWAANLVANVRYAPFSAMWNVLGWPAASVPVGMHPTSGTPIAVQIVAPPGGESTVLAVAAELERRQAWPRHAPV